MSRARVIGAMIGAVLLIGMGVSAFLMWPRGSSDVTKPEALAAFRDRSGSPAAAAQGVGDVRSNVPAEGVYELIATGEEVVKLGPLPAEHRQLSDVVTLVVVRSGPDCFDLTLNLFAEHTEDTRYCADGPELELVEHVKHQRIGALSPTATMRCDPGVLRGGQDVGHARELKCQLSLSGGPMAIEAEASGEAWSGRAGHVDVNGESVSAVPVTVDLQVTGDLSGAWRETTWWSQSNLPVRIERSLDLSGPATFREDSELTLRVLEPAT